ncbi:MAG: LCP family protein, partial [Solirubrobacterales bacterium]
HGLSDTTMLLRIDPDRNAIALFSIPRDLTVTIPGYGTATFNEAYSIGGPKLTLKTVKALTGLNVNHVVNVDFTGFAKAVSAIGCVYVDVDRRYYHSNEGLAAAAQYSEIDVRPGYQRLCGYNALEYVRFRHTDNDIVRNSRQQDFLREARARVPASDLLTKRHDLISIFTHYTTSDINSTGTMLQVMKLFIEARDEPVKEVHFPGTVARDVTVTPGQIEQAVSQFLGIEGTRGPRGQDAAPVGGEPAPAAETPPPPKVSKSEQKATAKAPVQQAPKPKKGTSSVAGLEGGNYGKKLAFRIQRRNRKMPIYYPTTVIAGSEYAQKPRAYTLADRALAPDERFSYKFVLKTPVGEYYGLQGVRWKDAPILDEPHETKKIGDRTYNLYYDNDRLRMVAWETDEGAYWVSNTLLQSLSADQMIAIARGAKVLEPTA